MNRTIYYLNTDLELVATVDLAPLAATLTFKGLFQLHLARHDECWYAAFEAGEPFDGPEPCIAAFLAVVESLDPVSRGLWSACASRTFDFGFECGDEPFGFRSPVTALTLARMVAVEASLHFTLYPSSNVRPRHDPETFVARDQLGSATVAS